MTSVNNIHRHLYKALPIYHKAFKAAATEPAQAEVAKALHKKLWQHRYLLFTNEENWLSNAKLASAQHSMLLPGRIYHPQFTPD